MGYGVVESTVESGNVFRHPIERNRTTSTYLAVAARLCGHFPFNLALWGMRRRIRVGRPLARTRRAPILIPS